MNVLVLNGSPKGDLSVTLRYLQYLERVFPEFNLEVCNVAQRIQSLEKKPEKFEEVITGVRQADLVVWSFPLYILLTCSQYKRFIELIFERQAEEAFAGQYAMAISTSIKYHDNWAQNYMRAISDDLAMNFLGAYSARMRDLTDPRERRRLEDFAQDILDGIEQQRKPPRLYAPVSEKAGAYKPATCEGKIGSGPIPEQGLRDKHIVILTDAADRDENINAMIDRMQNAFMGKAEIINLYDIHIAGGCLGCCRCGPEYRCAYTGKDGFIDFYNERLKPADIIVFAGTIRQRQLSWKFRQFFDRSFFNTHTPSLIGKQIAFVVSGTLSQLPEFRTVYQGWVELQQSNLLAFLSDEADSVTIDRQIDELATSLLANAQRQYIAPQSFLGIGGMKLFRDEIWAGLKAVFQADHKAYRKMGFYDFPQKQVARRLVMGLLTGILRLKPIRRKFSLRLKQQMTVSLDKVIEKASVQNS